MNPVSIDIKNILVQESDKSDGLIALTFGENLFIGREPGSPDNTIVIFDTPGEPPLSYIDSGEYNYDAVQLRIRNRDYATGFELAQQLKEVLHNRANEVWGSTYYCLIHSMGGPAFLEWDENDRCKFVLNLRIQRRKES